MLSHADNDHAGGALAVKHSLRPAQVISGEPERLAPELQASPCRIEEWSWSWDGVVFEQWTWAGARESNDRSCALEVEADGERILLTGDLPQSAELAWLAAHPAEPRVDWLLAPHHGSRSSSGAGLPAGDPSIHRDHLARCQ